VLKTLHESRLIEQVESLVVQTAEAAHLADALAQATTESAASRNTVNDIFETVLASAQPALLNTDRIERSYAPNLPHFTGNLEALTQLLGMLLSQAQRYVAAVGSHHRLRISTALVGPHNAPIHPGLALSTQATPMEVAIQIQETDTRTTTQEFPSQTIGNLFDAYAFIKQLGGRWDFRAPVGGLLSINVWIPLEQASHADRTSMPSPPPRTVANAESEPPPVAQVLTTAPPTPSTSVFPAPTSQPLPDRRKDIRTAANLPARLIIGNALYSGALTELSPTGATLEIDGFLPSLEHQSASVIVKTAASLLELHGTAYDRGGTAPQAGTEQHTSRLAFQFVGLDDIEHTVLVSLIEDVRTLAITVEALFAPTEQTDTLSESAIETVRRGTDHRETVRVRVSLPVRITTPSIKSGTSHTLGLAVNFSRGGLCLQTESCLTMTHDLIALHFSSHSAFDPPRGHEPEAPEAILTGRIVHITSDHTVPSELKPGLSQPGQLVGIRFEQLTSFAERDINRVIAQHTGSAIDLAGTTGWSSLVSTRRECRNARNQMIVMTDDHARHQISPSAPIILIVPGFGLTQTDYAPLSFSLAANGFRILRYDHTNHVGQSEGDILQITLRSMQSDLHGVLDFVRATWPSAPLTLFAEDIAARVAVKTLARSNSVAHLLLLNPVLNIDGALSAVYAPDAIGSYRQGVRRGIANLWGLNVNVDQFVSDAIAGDYTDVASSAADFARLTTPPILLTSPGSHRPLENMFGPQLQTFSAMGTVPVIVPLQVDLSENSSVYDERHTAACRTILNLISAPLTGNSPSLHIHEPNMRDVRRQQQLEYERIRLRHHVTQAARSALWIAHLAQLSQLGHQPDYWALENDLFRRLLPLEPDMTILDVGCGEGDLVRIMLTDLIYRSMYKSGLPDSRFCYIGAGYSQESLDLAKQYVTTFAQTLPFLLTTGLPTDRFLNTSWLHIDWHSPLPLTEGSIQRILCHLSLSFSPSPLHRLRHILRVLHPDGRAVITVLQPHTDLTTLFQRHLRTSAHDQDDASAQILLHHIGRLREAVRHGLLHSYERNEFTRLLVHAGADPIQIVPALGNQVLLAVIRNGKSTG
ncbi:MAG: methyltransferase domain-containing protein, partial [Nitrospira sp.]|nr:methyltransferase domain-containing protein [Nitrospira sp.]